MGSPTGPPARRRSLDVLRGLAVAAMILVNSPGSDEVFAPLRHADWNGLTPTDLIFPAFLAVMGASAAFSARGWGKALRRAALLAALGFLENLFVYPADAGARWPGVLQRVALCSLGVEAALAWEEGRRVLPLAIAVLAGYGVVLALAPLTPWDALPAALDRLLLGGHTLEPWGDPEGLLSTLGALGTSLLGAWAGLRLRRGGTAAEAEVGLAGLAAAALGAAWGTVLPFNKHLWTSSYALFTGGLLLAGLAASSAALDRARRTPFLIEPFEALGRRALAAYVLAGLAYDLGEYLGVKTPVTSWLAAAMPPKAASLLYALGVAGAAAGAAWLTRSEAPRSARAERPSARARSRRRSPSRPRTRTRAGRSAA